MIHDISAFRINFDIVLSIIKNKNFEKNDISGFNGFHFQLE
jgi:hypothetical protein